MKNVFFALTFMFFVNFAYSQQSVVVAGGSQSGVTGEFSYTIGLPIYGMSENGGKAFTIGVQQVFEAIEIMDVALDNVENNGENIMMDVVPNPFVDVVSVVLQGEDKKYSSYYLWIYDLSGNIVGNFDLLDGRGEYNLSHLSSGVYYFALVTEDYQLEQYFKIIKL